MLYLSGVKYLAGLLLSAWLVDFKEQWEKAIGKVRPQMKLSIRPCCGKWQPFSNVFLPLVHYLLFCQTSTFSKITIDGLE